MRSLTPLLAILALGTAPHIAANAADSAPAPAAQKAALSDDDRELLVESCHRIAYTVQATEQVTPRLTDAAAKDLIGVIKKDSEAMQRELQALMQDHGIGTPMLEEDYREDVNKVAKADQDDLYATYRDQQLEVSEDLADTLEEAAEESENAAVRAFAVKWQPSVRHHQQILNKYEPVQ